MRILHLDTGREMRGGQYQVLYLMRSLRERGVECGLLCRGPLLEMARAENLPAEPFSLRNLNRFGKDATILHAHDARSHTWASLRSSRTLVVSRRVGFPVGKGPLSRWKHGRPALYLAISNNAAGRLREAGVPEEKIRIVHDGVDALPEVQQRRDIVALDSNDPGKGRKLLEAAAATARVQSRFTRNLEESLRSARLFVYASTGEGLGSAALLAMSASVPVVASNIPGLDEVVEHNQTGILAENTPQSFAEAISRILTDDDLGRWMGKRGRARVSERFSLERMTSLTLEAYRSL
jgi:hypothetical protein